MYLVPTVVLVSLLSFLGVREIGQGRKYLT